MAIQAALFKLDPTDLGPERFQTRGYAAPRAPTMLVAIK
jgi:hypothetical protein